jgi:phosphopantothenoylcysteine decarboxylase / phosphopantothenate---cysteine ligase
VLGPSSQPVTNSSVKVIRVNSAEQMYQKSLEHFADSRLAIMSAAVADYTPVSTAAEKIKKNDGNMHVELKKTKDILASLGDVKKNGQFLVGFALETINEKEYALGKLKSKNADMIVLNSLNDVGAGFGGDTNKITIFDKNKQEYSFTMKSKKEVAKDIVDTIQKLMHV